MTTHFRPDGDPTLPAAHGRRLGERVDSDFGPGGFVFVRLDAGYRVACSPREVR
jgi:hypothetical protein